MDSRGFRGQRYSIYKYIYIYYIFAVAFPYIRKSKTLFGYFVIWLLRGMSSYSSIALSFRCKHLLSSNLHLYAQYNRIRIRPTNNNILLSLTNQVNPFSRSVPTQKKQGGAKTVRSKCLTLWGHLTPSTSQNMPCGSHLNRKIKDNPSFSASLESTSSTR